MSSRLDPWVTAAYRSGAGFAPDPAYADYLTAFAGDATLVDDARAEVARLTNPRGNRVLAESDHESTIRCATLVRMLAAFDERQT